MGTPLAIEYVHNKQNLKPPEHTETPALAPLLLMVGHHVLLCTAAYLVNMGRFWTSPKR